MTKLYFAAIALVTAFAGQSTGKGPSDIESPIALAPKAGTASEPEQAELNAQVNRPVDIASSAYQYRADRKAEENPPESWLALMHYAKLPLNKPLDVNKLAVKQVLCGLLWEEFRPVRQLELTWPAAAERLPAPLDLTITTLVNQGPASSWWHNTATRQYAEAPKVSADKRTYVYDLHSDTCGIVISLPPGQRAANFDVPTVRVLVADVWKKMDVEIEWGFDPATAANDYSGRVETYDGQVADFRPLEGDPSTKITRPRDWQSSGASTARRGIRFSLLYMGTSKWRKEQPFTTQRDDVARTIVTLWTKSGNFSFLAADLENGPILAPEYGFFVRRTSKLAIAPVVPLPEPTQQKEHGKKTPAKLSLAPSQPPIELGSNATSAREFIAELKRRKLLTIRQQIRAHAEQTWEGAVTAMNDPAMPGAVLPPHPQPPAGFEPPMQVSVPSERLTAQWNLGNWHMLRHAQKNPKNGRLWFDDFPYGILASETHLVLAALDLMGSHQAAADGFDQWVSLPLDVDPRIFPAEKFPAPPTGLFSDGHGALTHAIGPKSIGGQMDGIHGCSPGCIGVSLTEHYWLSGDEQWLAASAPRIKAGAEWMLRQRRLIASALPYGERLWCNGLQPPLQVTPDSAGLWMHFYEAEAYYLTSIARLAATLAKVDPLGAAALRAEAEAYRADLRRAVERSIALSPVVPVRDGTYHSVIPFACYVRGLGTGAWGWLRDGSGQHVGPLYWETVQSAAALICTARLLPPDDVRVQGWLDVLEDRLLLENPYVHQRVKGDWFSAGWQYQPGLERTANMHLVADDVPAFLRSMLNGYAVDILPNSGYTFNEHAVHGPPDKIFEEAAFLERFRDLLVMEDGPNLWLARACPRAWLKQGQKIAVKNAPTHFGNVDYEIVSDVDHGKISATINPPTRNPVHEVWLRLRHPTSARIKSVTVNGQKWTDFDPAKELVKLHDLSGRLNVEVSY